MNKYLKVLLVIYALTFSSAILAYDARFGEGALGVGFHSIELDDGGEVSSIGEFVRFSAGVKLKHTLSLSGSLRIWNNSEDVDDEGDRVEHALFHDFHLTSVSLGIGAQLFLPALAQGPYIKGGRHCWTANVRDVFNIWNGSGCSNIVGAGILFKDPEGSGGSFFGEVVLTRFKYVNTWMLAGGIRF